LKNGIGGFVVKAFTGERIDGVNDMVHDVLAHTRKVSTLGEEAADHAIVVFVDTALVRAVRMGEIRTESLNALYLGEFAPFVKRNCLKQRLVFFKAFKRFRHGFGASVAQHNRKPVACLAFRQSQYRAVPVLAYRRVALSMPEFHPVVCLCGAQVDTVPKHPFPLSFPPISPFHGTFISKSTFFTFRSPLSM
jgi:hypothetical protein